MIFKQKIDKMYIEMELLNIKKRRYAPYYYRLLWKLHLKISPPLHSSALSLLIVNFLCISIILLCTASILDYFFAWLIGDFGNILKTSILAGLFASIYLTISYRRQAKKLNLPNWSNY
jgi:Na+/melibiose symporter-like transporter